MNRLCLIFLLFFLLSSCQFGQWGRAAILSAGIRVVVEPYVQGGKVFSGKPVLYADEGGEKICRSRPFRSGKARKTLEKEGVEDDFLDELFGEEGEDVTESETVNLRRNESVRVDVGENWLEFGLSIANTNKGENRNYFLIIDKLSYTAIARYKGQIFETHGTLDGSYCDSSSAGGDTTPFLYLIPPNSTIEYRPDSANPFANLKIYISGFDIIDRSEQLSSSAQRRIQSNQNNQNNQNGQSGVGGGGQQGFQNNQQDTENQNYGPHEIIVVPDYNVELTLRGRFVTKTGIRVAGFVKRLSFFTQSDF